MCVKLEQESEGGERKKPIQEENQISVIWKKCYSAADSFVLPLLPPLASPQVVRGFRLSGWLKSNARDAARSESIEPIDNGQKANTFILMRLER